MMYYSVLLFKYVGKVPSVIYWLYCFGNHTDKSKADTFKTAPSVVVSDVLSHSGTSSDQNISICAAIKAGKWPVTVAKQ